ncbi:MAG: energy-coupled thiamine transporter ThiT [Ruminococcaceae bacterium]|nr:energy-coupled thiamine transporter ThiT [Oscillospiraceae bacterium]
MTNLTKKQKNRRLAESALMLALATILSELAVFNLPFGGSVTLFSQVPIILISYRYGVKWGLTTGLAMSVIQLIFGLENFSYVSGISGFLILAFFDYIIAFSALGLGGMFKGRIKNNVVAIALGGTVVTAIRFVCHFISGATIWKEYAEGAPVLEYSLKYNGSYMLPELIITIVGLVVIAGIFDLNSIELKTNIKKKAK